MSSLRLADRAEAPYYLPVGNEIDLFRACHDRSLPVMLKGPTGCGKTRFVEHMAHLLGRPLITVACHDDLSASDLTGRYLIRGSDTVWIRRTAHHRGAHGRDLLSRRGGRGAAGHARRHPSGHRRPAHPADREDGGAAQAAPGFQLVVSYNPGYQHALKDLKPSTRQRFVAIEFDFPSPARETEIVMHESGVPRATARALAELARADPPAARPGAGRGTGHATARLGRRD